MAGPPSAVAIALLLLDEEAGDATPEERTLE